MSAIKGYIRKNILHADDETPRKQAESLESIARATIGQTYLEDDPTVAEWFRGLVPTQAGAVEYVRTLFPSAQWVPRYNMTWLVGDAIAGVTVGLVVVPQAMAYALLARLSPAYGLYTTFTGACLYWVFGTSKDIVIGTTAVGSLLVGSVVGKIQEEHPGVYEAQEIAGVLSFLAGVILLFLGFSRLGWLIEFIPYIPISAFVTSASITIISTQFPTVMGIKGVNSRESPYLVYYNTFKGLGRSGLDAAIGLTSIALLFFVRDVCAAMEVRQPQRKRMWSMISSLRLTFTILFYTLISFIVNRGLPEDQAKFRIVGTIEKGFSHAGVPKIKMELVSLVTGELPAIVIILIVEHIAIAKSFGRIYGYTVIPSQEILAQGAANILSPFVGGYVCTGSFGASAVLSKAAVRTPLAGLFSALVLVLALYVLTPIFFFIPNAALAGLIIHATCNLVTPPRSLYKYWKLSPFEFVIWVIGVILAFFTDLETSIYTTVALSFVLMLVRMARTSGRFGGQVTVTRISRKTEDNDGDNKKPGTDKTREVFLPLLGKAPHNPNVSVEPPHPGVFIYRFSENFNYLNQAYHIDYLTSYIMENTRRTQLDDGVADKDRLWCEAPPSAALAEQMADKPPLRAVVLDFSTINILDLTSIQGLIDLRNTLDRYAAPNLVEWHFAGVHNRWTRRALAFAGFGNPAAANVDDLGNWCPAYTVATGFVGATAEEEKRRTLLDLEMQARDEEKWKVVQNYPYLQSEPRRFSQDSSGPAFALPPFRNQGMDPLFGVDRPFFHIDLQDAVEAAVTDAKKKEHMEDFPNDNKSIASTNMASPPPTTP